MKQLYQKSKLCNDNSHIWIFYHIINFFSIGRLRLQGFSQGLILKLKLLFWYFIYQHGSKQFWQQLLTKPRMGKHVTCERSRVKTLWNSTESSQEAWDLK